MLSVPVLLLLLPFVLNLSLWSSLYLSPVNAVLWSLTWFLYDVIWRLHWPWVQCVVSAVTWPSPSAVWENTACWQKDRGHPLSLTLMSLLRLWYCRLFAHSQARSFALSVYDRGIKNTCWCSFMVSSPASVNQRLSLCLFSCLQAWAWFTWISEALRQCLISSLPLQKARIASQSSHFSLCVLTHEKTHEVCSTGS